MSLPNPDDSGVVDATSEESYIAVSTADEPADPNPYAGVDEDLVQDPEFNDD